MWVVRDREPKLTPWLLTLITRWHHGPGPGPTQTEIISLVSFMEAANVDLEMQLWSSGEKSWNSNSRSGVHQPRGCNCIFGNGCSTARVLGTWVTPPTRLHWSITRDPVSFITSPHLLELRSIPHNPRPKHERGFLLSRS